MEAKTVGRWYTLGLLAGAAVGLARLLLVPVAPPLDLSPFTLFKDACHLYTGGLLAATFIQRRPAQVAMLVGLCVLETACAMWTLTH